ncbi:MAG: cytochrome c family protein [Deltaproteobacteria bacterium]|nr:cytochrome c family protein [Deltaproteobacteria bacterium]
MKGMKSISLVLFSLIFVVAWTVSVPSSAKAGDPQYIGVEGCTKKCHKKDKDGNALKAWQESKHSKTYKILGEEKAMKRGKENGVDNPQSDKRCLICHVTAYGESDDKFDKKFKKEDGVQCETCHGPGSEYKKKKVMQKIHKERGKGDKKKESATGKKLGMHFPSEETCKRCHVKEITINGETFKNPSWEEFDYAKRSDKIKHPVP